MSLPAGVAERGLWAGRFPSQYQPPSDPHCADLPGQSGQIFFRSTWPTT